MLASLMPKKRVGAPSFDYLENMKEALQKDKNFNKNIKKYKESTAIHNTEKRL